MSELQRRDAIRVVAGLAIGAVAVTRPGRGDTKGEPAKPEKDDILEAARRNPQNFMFTEKVSFLLETDGASRELDITSALDVDRKLTKLRVPSNSMRVFRADTSRDDFTRQGGVYWSFRGQEGKVQFKQPGAIILMIREDEVVRCYALESDWRC